MKKFRFRLNIIQLFIVMIFLVGGSVSFYLFYRGSTEIIFNMSEQISQVISEKIIQKTIDYLNAPAQQIQLTCRITDCSNLMDNKNMLWKVTWEQLQMFSYVYSIYLADKYGNFIQSRQFPHLATRFIVHDDTTTLEEWWYRNYDYQIIGKVCRETNYDPRTRPWYQKHPLLKQQIYWTDAYMFHSTGTLGITASYPILNKDGQLDAIVGVDIPLRNLSEFIAELWVSQNGAAFIFNQKGDIIAYPPKWDLIQQAHFTVSPAKLNSLKQLGIANAYQNYLGTSHNNRLIQIEGKLFVILFTSFPEAFGKDWSIGVMIPQEDLLEPVHGMIEKALLITLLILLATVIIVYIISNRINMFVRKLAQQTESIKDFRLDKIHPISSPFYEIEAMSDALLTATKGLSAFKKYVPADLVRQLILTGEEAKLGGKKTELTIFFSDIEGFTSISEALSPDALALHLSAYFNALSQIIMEQYGTIDKYIGDAIMAFWGAPIPLKDAPVKACRAALLCQAILDLLNDQWQAEGKPIIKTRIGLHTGEVVVGNMGAEQRMDYTIIGDSVNLASRLESANKIYNTKIIISQDTYQQVADHFFCRLLDIVAVKGRQQGVKIYQLIADKQTPISLDLIDLCRGYERAFYAYLDKDWQTALKILYSLEIYNDEAVAILIDRCLHFANDPKALPQCWDGTIALEKK